MLVYDTATRYKDKKSLHFRPFFVSYIAKGKINASHFPFYLNYFKKHACDKEIKADDFEKQCGIGVVISDDEILNSINEVLKSKQAAIDKNGWGFGYGPVLGQIKKKLPFADSAKVVQTLDDELTKKLGPRPSNEEVKKAAKQKKSEKGGNEKKQTTKKENNKKQTSNDNKSSETSYETLSDAVQFHDPKDNIQATKELLEEHLKITGGKVRTRFPPEPNVSFLKENKKSIFNLFL